MKICRFHHPRKGARVGLVHNGRVYDLTEAAPDRFSSIKEFLSLQNPAREIKAALDEIERQEGLLFGEIDIPPDPCRPHLLAPIDHQEVWGAGVTYLRSKTARMEESKEAADHYGRLYDAVRPEIFFKATPHRTVGPNAAVRIRRDATWNVPEPELALALGPDLRAVGYTIGNDMSSRDIEGENPLYLPQAKIYMGCCALGPVITLAEFVPDPTALSIELAVERTGRVIFRGRTSVSEMKRSFSELIEYLGRENSFPAGAFLLTGTGIVPPTDFTLEEGDIITIDIKEIGTLRNIVQKGG